MSNSIALPVAATVSTVKSFAKVPAIVRNAKLKYVRIGYAKVDSYGNALFSLAMVTSDEGQRASWESMGLTVKAHGDEFICNLVKHAVTPKGVKVAAPMVFDRFGKQSIDASSVTEGTVADVRILQYSNAAGELKSILSAVKVVSLVKYDHAAAVAAEF